MKFSKRLGMIHTCFSLLAMTPLLMACGQVNFEAVRATAGAEKGLQADPNSNQPAPEPGTASGQIPQVSGGDASGSIGQLPAGQPSVPPLMCACPTQPTGTTAIRSAASTVSTNSGVNNRGNGNGNGNVGNNNGNSNTGNGNGNYNVGNNNGNTNTGNGNGNYNCGNNNGNNNGGNNNGNWNITDNNGNNFATDGNGNGTPATSPSAASNCCPCP
jgi:hypothetical protein